MFKIDLGPRFSPLAASPPSFIVSAVSRPKLRRLTIDGTRFLWRMDWTYDLDGERIIDFSALHTAPARESPRPRGQPLRARFLPRMPAYPVDTTVVLPADARAAIDRGRALGWDGTHLLWLLPACGLDRPALVLSGPTRLHEWAGTSRVYALYILDVADGPLAGLLAADLAVPAVPEAAAAAEAQWRDERWFVLRSRHGGTAAIYCRTPADLAVALTAATRRAATVGLSVRALGAQILGPGVGEVPLSTVPAPESWAALPGAERHRGPREIDVIWTITGPDGVRVESYHHHPDAPDRLWIWLSIHGDTAVERRFRR